MRSDTSRRRLIILICAAGLAILTVIGFGIYGLLIGPPDKNVPVSSDPTPTVTTSPNDATTTPNDLLALPKTTDPVVYARAVADALFTWDTLSGRMPVEYGQPIITDADPSGYETNGLVTDLSNYLPTTEVWQQLRQYRTTQSLSIDDAFVPESWPAIAADAGNQIAKGTVAVTIEGTRHREGFGFGQPAVSDHPIAFTIFLICPPTADRCHTLRLSLPDSPLK